MENPKPGDSSYDPLVGGKVVAISHRTLWWAIDLMLEALPPEKLSKLDMRAGEHLAAILTTAFLGTGPSDIDTTGGGVHRLV